MKDYQMNGTEFLIERRLRELDPDLHRRFTDAVFVLHNMLTDYLLIFPEYTDHSAGHSMVVIDLCGRLMGEEQIMRMNADDLFVLLMGCYFHDIGMGVSAKDYPEFLSRIHLGNYFDTNDPENKTKLVRDFHHEFSALFVLKYAKIFDLPSDEYAFAIAQAARGHRHSDLYNETDYPAELLLPNGNTIHLPYIAALLRIADELDVAADRNPELIIDMSLVTNEVQQLEYAKHRAVRDLEITKDAITMFVETPDEAVLEGVVRLAGKIQATLEYCVSVARNRTPYEITQTEVVVNRVKQ